MGMTYFRRYRMELDLRDWTPHWDAPDLEQRGYEWVPYDDGLIREHAAAKYHSFRSEMDADVFPCLSRRDGCLRLMREITGRASFVPNATWLIRYRDRVGGRPIPVGTIQGLDLDEWGAVQNLGVVPEHRGNGLGALLMMRSAAGFQSAGLKRMHLEVTTANTPAVRLYERLGFRQAKVVYKACEVAGV
ncbi:GNAT family N-acetyltransferase [Rhodopirellula halodulae]|uniref:GNAT family N-acetyltransferase n=1 Tax=Rhodopirellula halodulae TaxID=2894198 RepID=UPI001E3E5E0E|nr:GNAT family N-acetyltransferase [Rhodopirellula sp. JC737]MCC9656580.1 GNAT family N-acetyltransferase [Rhodopirellula sp. JC737]